MITNQFISVTNVRYCEVSHTDLDRVPNIYCTKPFGKYFMAQVIALTVSQDNS